MSRRVSMRFWWESGLACATGLLAVVTAFRHGWLETFGLDPDHGDGAVEWLAVAILGLVCLVSTIAARLEWRATGQVGRLHSTAR